MSFDKTELFRGALIQHGPFNKRIYLMSIRDANPDDLIEGMLEKCKIEGYTKIFAKVPLEYKREFTSRGFTVEAEVPGFYNGYQAAVFLGYYLSRQRMEEDVDELNRVLSIAESRHGDDKVKTLASGFHMKRCAPDDVVQMANVYQVVFPSYPFPIHDSEYLLETMKTHIHYFCVCKNDQIVSISSAEMDPVGQNVEMTDFATLPGFRGHSFGQHLLKRMEEHVQDRGIQLAYTIARACSPGMNITFSKRDYLYAGRLVNNTQISGRIESMNVWYKSLDN